MFRYIKTLCSNAEKADMATVVKAVENALGHGIFFPPGHVKDLKTRVR